MPPALKNQVGILLLLTCLSIHPSVHPSFFHIFLHFKYLKDVYTRFLRFDILILYAKRWQNHIFLSELLPILAPLIEIICKISQKVK